MAVLGWGAGAVIAIGSYVGAITLLPANGGAQFVPPTLAQAPSTVNGEAPMADRLDGVGAGVVTDGVQTVSLPQEELRELQIGLMALREQVAALEEETSVVRASQMAVSRRLDTVEFDVAALPGPSELMMAMAAAAPMADESEPAALDADADGGDAAEPLEFVAANAPTETVASPSPVPDEPVDDGFATIDETVLAEPVAVETVESAESAEPQTSAEAETLAADSSEPVGTPSFIPPPPVPVRVVLPAPNDPAASPELLIEPGEREIVAAVETPTVAVTQRPMLNPVNDTMADRVTQMALDLIADPVEIAMESSGLLFDDPSSGQSDPLFGALEPLPSDALAPLPPAVTPEAPTVDVASVEPAAAASPDGDTLVTGALPANEPSAPDALATANDPNDSVLFRTDFGVDLGGVSTLEEIDMLWERNETRHTELLGALTPRIMLRQEPDGSLDLRLVAGPIGNAADAALMCAQLMAAGGAQCLPSIYDGQLLNEP